MDPYRDIEPRSRLFNASSKLDISLLFNDIEIGNTVRRQINIKDSSQYLIVTDGSCFTTTTEYPDSIGICAVSWGSYVHPNPETILTFYLETGGYDGLSHNATTARAQLRAVIAAIELKDWHTECHSLVVTTKSADIVRAITYYINEWRLQGHKCWIRPDGTIYEDIDLLQRLDLLVLGAARRGCLIYFWQLEKNILPDPLPDLSCIGHLRPWPVRHVIPN